MMLDPKTIVYCHGCDRRVRASVTTEEPTGEDGDLERWCFECVATIDKHSEFLAPESDPTTDSPPAWEDDMRRFLQDEEGT